MLPELRTPNELTYVGVFLTLRCNFRCSYCINGEVKPRKEMTAEQWIDGLNRLQIPREKMVPLTIQGGEPSIHKGFLEILEGIRQDLYLDILTNLSFNVRKFCKAALAGRFEREVPYASIRASYHPEYDMRDTLDKALFLQTRGYDVGVFMVDHPDSDVDKARKKAEGKGVDFRIKEFLGWHDGILEGKYKHPLAVAMPEKLSYLRKLKAVKCKSTELLIGPNGYIYRCHRDLYKGERPVMHITEEGRAIEFKFRECDKYGECNPCDIKVKNNRFQEMGACAVEIRDG